MKGSGSMGRNMEKVLGQMEKRLQLTKETSVGTRNVAMVNLYGPLATSTKVITIGI